ncbi:MAG TPA: FCD domain-containing protein [Actinomycetes bacterium]|nr:FCD domain-containing protein [Actinomycetes bacterium]
MTLSFAPARASLAGELLARIESRAARVAVLGLGYVGLPLAETFAWGGFPVLGFDVDPHKVARLKRGESYIGHICPERVAELNASGRFEPTDDPARFVEADVGFHLRVAEAAGNVVLSDMLNGVRALLRVWIRRVIEAAGETGPSYGEHLPIFEAIERGDRAAAIAAMSAHMEGASARLKATISQSAWSRRDAAEG